MSDLSERDDAIKRVNHIMLKSIADQAPDTSPAIFIGAIVRLLAIFMYPATDAAINDVAIELKRLMIAMRDGHQI